MAVIKFSPIVSEARGKVGDVVFSRNSYSAYVRGFVVPTNPNTLSQQNVRGRFGGTAQMWRQITPVQRQQWKAQSEYINRTNIFGDSTPLTAFNWFMRANQNRVVLGAVAIPFPVLTPPPPQFTVDNIAADTTGGTLIVSFSPVVPVNVAIVVYGTTGLSAGVNFVKSEYRLFSVIPNPQVSPIDLTVNYVSIFGALPLVGEKVFVKLRAIDVTSGIDSVIHQNSAIAI